MIFQSDAVIVRPATFEDIDVLRRFEQGVIRAERPFDVTLADDPIQYYDIEMMIAVSHIELVVAEIEGELVGAGYARIEEAKPYLRHTQYVYLGFMYVVPEHRGKGINQKVIDVLMGWAKERGITEMQLEVYCGNLPAIRAYEKIGFEQLLITMRRPIE